MRVWDAVEFIERVVAERESWTLGGAATDRYSGVCPLSESPVAVMVTGTVPRVAEAEAVMVRVEVVVAAPGEKLLVLQAAVTPEGRSVTARVTAPEKAPLVTTETGRVVVLPWTTDAMGKAERASLALPRMVIGRLRDWASGLAVAVRTTFPVPGVAEEATVMVTVEDCPGLMEVGLKLTETPVGAEAVRATVPA
jgi:hypothetical protein